MSSYTHWLCNPSLSARGVSSVVLGHSQTSRGKSSGLAVNCKKLMFTSPPAPNTSHTATERFTTACKETLVRELPLYSRLWHHILNRAETPRMSTCRSRAMAAVCKVRRALHQVYISKTPRCYSHYSFCNPSLLSILHPIHGPFLSRQCVLKS